MAAATDAAKAKAQLAAAKDGGTAAAEPMDSSHDRLQESRLRRLRQLATVGSRMTDWQPSTVIEWLELVWAVHAEDMPQEALPKMRGAFATARVNGGVCATHAFLVPGRSASTLPFRADLPVLPPVCLPACTHACRPFSVHVGVFLYFCCISERPDRLFGRTATLKVLTSAQIRVLLVEPNGLEPVVAELVARKRDQHSAAEAAFARVFGTEAEAEAGTEAGRRRQEDLQRLKV